jgi:hypothetical protein
MIDIDGLVQDFEVQVQSSIDEIVNEFPALNEYENRRPIDSLVDDLSSAIYRKLEDLLESEMEKAVDDLHDAIGDSSSFLLTDFDGDRFYITHKETGIDLRLTVEDD